MVGSMLMAGEVYEPAGAGGYTCNTHATRV